MIKKCLYIFERLTIVAPYAFSLFVFWAIVYPFEGNIEIHKKNGLITYLAVGSFAIIFVQLSFNRVFFGREKIDDDELKKILKIA